MLEETAVQKPVFVGSSELPVDNKEVQGSSITLGDEEFYVIRNVDQMDPFFMTIVSSSDHWMFISSNGALSAGRVNSESALFPYYTDDKITQSAGSVGSKTSLRVHRDDKVLLWRPFSGENQYRTTNNLFKNRLGNRIIFEETNHDLELTFRYSWEFSKKYGFVKRAKLLNLSHESQNVDVLDGLQNLVPYGVGSAIQSGTSNLVNGYKRNILDPSGIGVFTLSAVIVDRAEPSEALKATTVWCAGLDHKTILLSDKQVSRFERSGELDQEVDVKGITGSFLISASLDISQSSDNEWIIIADVNQDRASISDLSSDLTRNEIDLLDKLEEDIRETSKALRVLVAKADGLQMSGDQMGIRRHASNVLFNIMRGGIFEDNYTVDVSDFLDYLKTINKPLFKTHAGSYDADGTLTYQELIAKSKEAGDADLIRISYEYLPLTFSRRHGDPSRPWNLFNIELNHPDGSKKRSYEGNWRDIFQNWEALAYSFPDYSMGMIYKFLNASTIDGYNPYRITREGIDWETIEPDDPWSYIGYWGDHQIIYLQKLLECAIKHDENAFANNLNEQIFVYANVPYSIRTYDELVQNPKETVDLDLEKEARIEELVSQLGADGKMVIVDSQLLKASFIEKILVTLLAKLSNFVPEGGIWLNTQRPEWNDANNALVGNGVSMVTLYYLRRFCEFVSTKVLSDGTFKVHTEVAEMLSSIHEVFLRFSSNLDVPFDNVERKKFVDALGRIGEQYRNAAYSGFSAGSKQLDSGELKDFLKLTVQYIDHSIRANRRGDGLYHSYNLLEFDGDELKLDHLYEMLEGQVAVMSSGLLSGTECIEILDALKASEMYREDQYSYFLYPNRDIPHLLEKNQIPAEFVENSILFSALKEHGNVDLVNFDTAGNCYFNGDIHNANDVKVRLDSLTEWDHLVKAERDAILDVFEEMFDHKSFTGRSGTFFAFEGLGSIYWHMVSKLLVATQENIYWKYNEMSDDEKGRIVQHYYEIRAGIGVNKSPELYGAFPSDAYSHTPLHRGAQQPGMTGQVKEDILNRWAVLGVNIESGQVSFTPKFLNEAEFLEKPAPFHYCDLNDDFKSFEVEKGQLAFTYCQVPIVYERAVTGGIKISLSNNDILVDGTTLTKEVSRELFERSDKIKKIHVYLPQ